MAALVTLLIGHRGAGKTTLLERLSARARTVDLDAEIARRQGLTDLFAQGEARFREWEKETLESLVASANERTFIAVGAGCEGPLPERAHVVWIRRATDSQGRSFLDRPRLDADELPLAEFFARHPERERRYRAWAHEELILPEGYEGGLEGFFEPRADFRPAGELTLLAENFKDLESFTARRDWVRRFEIRDDLLNAAQIQEALLGVAEERRLYSCRTATSRPQGLSDWALELGPPMAPVAIESRHGPNLEFHSSRAIQKSAQEVNDFEELLKGHRWWMEDPRRRAFLPRSKDGRWRWYRSLFGPRMPIHFVREGDGSSPDQPYFWQTQLQPPLAANFAAVLGFPVEHSRTPLEQLEFFKRLGMPVVAIPIAAGELRSALPILQALGLTHAAVTSPLKEEAFALATRLSGEARIRKSVNTLQLKNREWHGHNTDAPALKDLRREIGAPDRVWLWGGGGIKSGVLAEWPGATAISARQGTADETPPDLLIWAAPRAREFVFPRAIPKKILDLNYGDDSPGLEFAALHKVEYVSGLRLFKLQAAYQREYWSG